MHADRLRCGATGNDHPAFLGLGPMELLVIAAILFLFVGIPIIADVVGVVAVVLVT